MHIFLLDQPQQWRMGQVSGNPIFASCGGCHDEEPIIVGYLGASEGDDQTAVGVIIDGQYYRMAVYCRSCFDQILSGERSV